MASAADRPRRRVARCDRFPGGRADPRRRPGDHRRRRNRGPGDAGRTVVRRRRLGRPARRLRADGRRGPPHDHARPGQGVHRGRRTGWRPAISPRSRARGRSSSATTRSPAAGRSSSPAACRSSGTACSSARSGSAAAIPPRTSGRSRRVCGVRRTLRPAADRRPRSADRDSARRDQLRFRQAGVRCQQRRLVGPLPRQVEVRPAEVAVGGGLAVDRPAQVERGDDRGRAEIEVAVDQRLDLASSGSCRSRTTRP